MRAIIWESPGVVRLADVAEPQLLEATDVIVRVEYASTCGTDLHAYRGGIADFEPGTILGHECVGRIHAVGQGVKGFQHGQRVRAADFSACGMCRSCLQGVYASCRSWRLFGFSGNQPRLDGALAELIRVPSADTVLCDFAVGLDPRLGLLGADVLPTALDALKGWNTHNEQCVTILGAGPIGIATAYLAQKADQQIILIEKRSARITRARALGFTVWEQIDPLAQQADIVVDAIGGQKGLQLALDCVRAGGLVVAAGAQGAAYPIDWHDMCKRNLTIRGVIGDPIANRAQIDRLITTDQHLAELLFSDHILLQDIPQYYESLLKGEAFKALVQVA